MCCDFLAGALCALGDGFLDRGFRAVLPLDPVATPLWMLGVESLLTAVAVTMAFGVTDRIAGRESRRRWR